MAIVIEGCVGGADVCMFEWRIIGMSADPGYTSRHRDGFTKLFCPVNGSEVDFLHDRTDSNEICM